MGLISGAESAGVAGSWECFTLQYGTWSHTLSLNAAAAFKNGQSVQIQQKQEMSDLFEVSKDLVVPGMWGHGRYLTTGHWVQDSAQFVGSQCRRIGSDMRPCPIWRGYSMRRPTLIYEISISQSPLVNIPIEQDYVAVVDVGAKITNESCRPLAFLPTINLKNLLLLARGEGLSRAMHCGLS